jgi:DNA-binding CsgD family transcriptional regulator
MFISVTDASDPWKRRDSLLRLSARQVEVAALVAEGRSSSEAGRALNLSPRTIDRHVNLAMESVTAHSRAHLVALCYWGELLRIDSWPPRPAHVFGE